MVNTASYLLPCVQQVFQEHKREARRAMSVSKVDGMEKVTEVGQSHSNGETGGRESEQTFG